MSTQEQDPGKGDGEDKKATKIRGISSQVDSADIYKASAAATMTLGPLGTALFKLKKKKKIFARRLILVQISQDIPSIRALHGAERSPEQTSIPSGQLHAPRLGVSCGEPALVSYFLGGKAKQSCSEISDSLQRRLDRTSKIRYHRASALGGFR